MTGIPWSGRAQIPWTWLGTSTGKTGKIHRENIKPLGKSEKENKYARYRNQGKKDKVKEIWQLFRDLQKGPHLYWHYPKPWTGLTSTEEAFPMQRLERCLVERVQWKLAALFFALCSYGSYLLGGIEYLQTCHSQRKDIVLLTVKVLGAFLLECMSRTLWLWLVKTFAVHNRNCKVVLLQCKCEWRACMDTNIIQLLEQSSVSRNSLVLWYPLCNFVKIGSETQEGCGKN